MSEIVNQIAKNPVLVELGLKVHEHRAVPDRPALSNDDAAVESHCECAEISGKSCTPAENLGNIGSRGSEGSLLDLIRQIHRA